MRNEAQLQQVVLQAKTWYNKAQQKLPIIRETRLPSLTENEIYIRLANCFFLIGCLSDLSQTEQFRNLVADTLVGNQMQTKISTGKTYVETNYDFNNDYVYFNQDHV